jgi:type II pantothenate kinase
LTASNFGNPSISSTTAKKEDMLASVIGMVGETVSTMSVLAAAQCKVSHVVYAGSTFIQNDLLREVVEGYTRFRGADPVFVEHGEFSGAIGAVLTEPNLP